MEKSTKKRILLIGSLVIIGFMSWYTYNLMNKSNVSDSELIAFNYEDVKNIDKIRLSDSYGYIMEVQKKGTEWVDAEGRCIQQEGVEFILEAFKNIEFKGYLPENARSQQIKMMVTQHIKVEIFENEEWSKHGILDQHLKIITDKLCCWILKNMEKVICP